MKLIERTFVWRKRRERAVALLSALAVVAILSLIMSGVILLASSHESRQVEESNYMLALPLAEAGINYEMNYMSANGTTCPTTSQTCSGSAGSFTVSATNTSGGTWTSGSNAIITATGTYNDMTRKVQITSAPAGTPIFASNGVTNGPSAARQTSLPQIVNWPTVTQLANQRFANGYSTISSASAIAAQSARILQFVGTGSTTLSPSNTKSANWPTSGTTATQLNDTNCASLNQKAVILTPGDYYFTQLSFSGSTTIYLDSQNLSTGGTPV